MKNIEANKQKLIGLIIDTENQIFSVSGDTGNTIEALEKMSIPGLKTYLKQQESKLDKLLSNKRAAS